VKIEDLVMKLMILDEWSVFRILVKQVCWGGIANSNGNRYPARTLYCIVFGLNRHLSDIKGNEMVNILDNNDRF
jgi:hypothetical protein